MVALLALSLFACGGENQAKGRRLPDGSRLIQKKEFQALYGPAGRLQRVLNDVDGDGVAEAIVYYRSDGKPERSELDTDGDHILDRWETLRPDGSVAVSASSRRANGRADTWEYADTDKLVYQTDFDEPDPTAEDLLRLCQEEDLDFVAIGQKIDGVECLGNGHVYVYDCDAILANWPSDTAVAVHP